MRKGTPTTSGDISGCHDRGGGGGRALTGVQSRDAAQRCPAPQDASAAVAQRRVPGAGAQRPCPLLTLAPASLTPARPRSCKGQRRAPSCQVRGPPTRRAAAFTVGSRLRPASFTRAVRSPGSLRAPPDTPRSLLARKYWRSPASRYKPPWLHGTHSREGTPSHAWPELLRTACTFSPNGTALRGLGPST